MAQPLLDTNVLSLKRGRGVSVASAEHHKFGKFIVCTMEIPWELTHSKLGEKPQQVIMVTSLEETVMEELFASITTIECDTFVGIGGGQAIDAAKYLAWRSKKRLVSIPTIISVDAIVTPAAGIRRGDDVVYIGEASPDPLIIDYDLIRLAPTDLNVAGVGDILSIHTAVFDWELAHENGKSEYPFSSDDVLRAKENLSEVMDKVDDIANVSDVGLDVLLNGYLKINKVCLPAGHYRTEEGSEHYVFYALEKKYRRPFIHGHIVGLGMYLMTKLQANDSKRIIEFMDRIGLRYHPVDLEITHEGLKDVLLGLRDFVESRKNLWFTIINKTTFTEELVDKLMEGLRF